MNLKKQHFIGAIGLALMATSAQAQLVVSTNLTPTQLVQDVLLGSGITVSNVEFNGILEPTTAQPGTGSFVATGTNLDIPSGIILTTGTRSYTYADRLHVMPIDRLWTPVKPEAAN